MLLVYLKKYIDSKLTFQHLNSNIDDNKHNGDNDFNNDVIITVNKAATILVNLAIDLFEKNNYESFRLTNLGRFGKFVGRYQKYYFY